MNKEQKLKASAWCARVKGRRGLQPYLAAATISGVRERAEHEAKQLYRLGSYRVVRVKVEEVGK